MYLSETKFAFLYHSCGNGRGVETSSKAVLLRVAHKITITEVVLTGRLLQFDNVHVLIKDHLILIWAFFQHYPMI